MGNRHWIRVELETATLDAAVDVLAEDRSVGFAGGLEVAAIERDGRPLRLAEVRAIEWSEGIADLYQHVLDLAEAS